MGYSGIDAVGDAATYGGYSAYGKKAVDPNKGGSDGQGFSIGGMGGKSGALGKYDVLGQQLDNANPWLQQDKKNKAAAAQSAQDAQDLYTKTGQLNTTLDTADQGYKSAFNDASTGYLNTAKDLVGDYTSKITDLSNQAQNQATSAQANYTNNLLPEYKNVMSGAKNNASQAMTLAQAGDPNNPVMTAVRALYDKEGQAARQQGQQDFGILSGLGAEASAQQFGSAATPMTAGQMGQISAANQSQAGAAYAKAQARMYDLQNQGLNKGFDQSNKLYDAGQQAQQAYAKSISALQNAGQQNDAEQGAYRGELGGYAGDTMGVNAALNTDTMNMGMTGAGIDRDNSYAGTGRQQNALNQLYGAKQQITNNDQQAAGANNASKGQFVSSLASLFTGMSDKREKKNINDISNSDLDEFLSAVKPKSFDYKDAGKPGTQPGKRVGFMMQDVQGTKLGDKMTRRGPSGELMYDKDNLNGILLAGLARQNKRRAA